MTYRPFAWLRRAARRGTQTRSTARANVEVMEARCLLSTSPAPVAAPLPAAVEETPGVDMTAPVLINQQLIGPIDGVTQIKLTFSERLDPATAENTAAYAIIRVFHK